MRTLGGCGRRSGRPGSRAIPARTGTDGTGTGTDGTVLGRTASRTGSVPRWWVEAWTTAFRAIGSAEVAVEP